MTIVDTSVWIDYFNGKPSQQADVLDSLLGVEEVGVGDLILVELLQGFRRDADYKKAKQLLMSFPLFEMLGISRAINSVDYYRALRKKGITVLKTTDVIIASFCIGEGYSLLHSDRDFDPFVKHFGLKSIT